MRFIYTPIAYFISILCFLFYFENVANAQCSPEETLITIAVYSVDVWAEETYWELAPSGNGCGNGTLLSGSNAEVGCGVGGPTGENGMPDYGIEGFNICLPTGSAYDLFFFDSYGDGGLAFEIYQNGLLSGTYWGTGSGNTWTFVAGLNLLPAYDSPCGAQQLFPDSNSVTLYTGNCIASFLEVSPDGNSCTTYGMWCEGAATQTAWAYFIAEEGMSYEISTCNSGTTFDTQIALWHGIDCFNQFEFELVSANDNRWGGCNAGNPNASTCYASCLIPGDIYYIMVDGYAGETGNAEISVSTFSGEMYLQTQVNDVNCPLTDNDTPTGSLFPSIVGTGSDFVCAWNGPNGYYSTDHFIYNLAPGTYTLTATSNCGEIFTGEYLISLPEPWAVSINVSASTCPNSNDGGIEVNASGASPEYNYTYNGPANYYANGQAVFNCPIGNYLVSVGDSHGCVYQQNVLVTASDALTFDLGQDTTLCLGEDLLVYGPGGLNYLWQDGSSNQFYYIVSDEIGVGTSAVILTASSNDGCTHTDVLVVTIEQCVGVGEINSEINSIVLYPNPAHSLLNLSSSNKLNGLYTIVNTMGSVVSSGKLTSENPVIDVQNLANGIYFIRLNEAVLKFIKE